MDPAPPSKAKVFLRRLLSTVILWTVVLLALFSGYKQVSDYVFLVMIVVLAVTGLARSPITAVAAPFGR